MKEYTKTKAKTIQAVQYVGQEHALVKRVYYDYMNNPIVEPLNPSGSILSVKTENGWEAVRRTDWIVNKKNKIYIVKDNIFQLLYDEA